MPPNIVWAGKSSTFGFNAAPPRPRSQDTALVKEHLRGGYDEALSWNRAVEALGSPSLKTDVMLHDEEEPTLSSRPIDVESQISLEIAERCFFRGKLLHLMDLNDVYTSSRLLKPTSATLKYQLLGYKLKPEAAAVSLAAVHEFVTQLGVFRQPADISAYIRANPMLAHSTILARNSLSQKPVKECRMRSVYNYSMDGNGFLGMTSYPVEEMHRSLAFSPVLDLMDPLTHSDAIASDVAGLTKMSADVKHCDHYCQRWMAQLYCELEAAHFDLSQCDFTADTLACANVCLLYEGGSSFSNGETFYRQFRLLPSGANKVKLIQTFMSLWCTIHAALRVWKRVDYCAVSKFGMLADNVAVFSKSHDDVVEEELVRSFDEFNFSFKPVEGNNFVDVSDTSFDFLGFRITDGAPVLPMNKFFRGWELPERRLADETNSAEADMMQVARACGYSQVNMGIHPEVSFFCADVVKRYSHENVELPTLVRDGTFRSFDIAPGKLWSTTMLYKRRASSPYRGIFDFPSFLAGDARCTELVRRFVHETRLQ
uniref:RdRp n=1 Tax=viral metagenome TaxID=1070528 RepID=A0A2V0R8W9_9ZZZZ